MMDELQTGKATEQQVPATKIEQLIDLIYDKLPDIMIEEYGGRRSREWKVFVEDYTNLYLRTFSYVPKSKVDYEINIQTPVASAISTVREYLQCLQDVGLYELKTDEVSL